jgi:hypothetical protein
MIPAYKSQPRKWCEPGWTACEQALGAELEVVAHSEDDQDEIVSIAADHDCLAENDPSLGDLGVELVIEPEPLSAWLEGRSLCQKVATLIRERGLAAGYSAHQDGRPVGLHLSRDRKQFDERLPKVEQRQRFAVASLLFRDVTRAVFGRGPHNGGFTEPDRLWRACLRHRCTSLSVETYRVELRWPRSTLNADAMRRYAQGIASLEAFAVGDPDEWPATHPGLVRFLWRHGRREGFAELLERLALRRLVDPLPDPNQLSLPLA